MPSADSCTAASAPPVWGRREPHIEADAAALNVLAVEASGRDSAALRRFLEAIVPSVRSVCRAVLGAGHADLEDTIQDCLIEILRALPKYRFEGAVLSYTNRIALRAAIAARKRGRNREKRRCALAEQKSANITSGRQDTLPDLWLLRGIIDELPTVQAEAVVMRIVLGYSIEEIAAATRVSVNTTKSRLRVAKEYLRRRIKSDGRLGEAELGPSDFGRSGAAVPFARFSLASG